MTTPTTLSFLNASPEPARKEFGPYQEEAIISLAFDHPEFFLAVGRFVTPELFDRLECRFIIAEILNSYNQYEVLPTRKLLRDVLASKLTTSDPYESVFAIIDRPTNHRDVPIIKDTLIKWAKNKAFGLIYSEEAMAAYANEDFGKLQEIINSANRISDFSTQGFWFMSEYQKLFSPSIIEHRTTGFPKLDKLLNNGGPSPKEVCCWMAPTNVGKSIFLCNNAISSLKGMGSGGVPGQDVLLVTFELDAIKTAMRCLGATTKLPLHDLVNHQEYITRMMDDLNRVYNKRIFIAEMPPGECSVNHIYALMDNLKRVDGWKPDVVIIDYLDLMVSRHPLHNKDDYTQQKHVATEVRGLAKNENVLVFTATQTNRAGATGEELIDLTKAAESFGKAFPLDYVISLNQSKADRLLTPPAIELFICKNRNGPKNETIRCSINYDCMLVLES